MYGFVFITANSGRSIDADKTEHQCVPFPIPGKRSMRPTFEPAPPKGGFPVMKFSSNLWSENDNGSGCWSGKFSRTSDLQFAPVGPPLASRGSSRRCFEQDHPTRGIRVQ